MLITGKVWLHRKIQDWPYYRKDSRYVHLWTHLIMAAVWKDTLYMFDGKEVILKPGQFATGRYQLERDTGIHNQFIKRALLRWESDHQIERHRGAKGSIITILNWGVHQGSDHLSDQQVTSKRPASDQQVTTKEEVKEVKEVKNRYLDFVMLTDREHQKLTDRMNNKLDGYIYDLNTYIGTHGKKYKSHYFALLGFERRDLKANKRGGGGKTVRSYE